MRKTMSVLALAAAAAFGASRLRAMGCQSGGQSLVEMCHAMVAAVNWETDAFDEMIGVGENPILVPTDRAQVFKLTSVADGVVFDLDADGVKELTAWTEAGANLAFLAYDKNGNGEIDNGSELFGSRTLPGVAFGFAALAQIDIVNGPSGWIDHDDPIYAKLLLWTDKNHNGVSEPGELRPARELLTRIGLGYYQSGRKDGHGNLFQFQGWATIRTAPGKNDVKDAKDDKERQIVIYDVILAR